jgi:hypothetical protein
MHLFDDAFSETTAAAFGQRARLAQAHVFGV